MIQMCFVNVSSASFLICSLMSTHKTSQHLIRTAQAAYNTPYFFCWRCRWWSVGSLQVISISVKQSSIIKPIVIFKTSAHVACWILIGRLVLRAHLYFHWIYQCLTLVFAYWELNCGSIFSMMSHPENFFDWNNSKHLDWICSTWKHPIKVYLMLHKRYLLHNVYINMRSGGLQSWNLRRRLPQPEWPISLMAV